MSNNIDLKALYNIGYGLYVLTTYDGMKHNGMISNTVFQLTGNPVRVGVAVNKANYSCRTIEKTGIMNINCLTVDTPFSVFEKYGFASGRDTDKFSETAYELSENGLVILKEYINSYMSLKVEQSLDFDTHILFICTVTESRTVNTDETMSYTYYHKNVKPKPQPKESGEPKQVKENKYMCRICGYVYTGESLPEDYVCPICKHPASDFELME